jgi:hypothetical protein
MQPLQYKLGCLNSLQRRCNGACHLPVSVNVSYIESYQLLLILTLLQTTKSKTNSIYTKINKSNLIYEMANVI